MKKSWPQKELGKNNDKSLNDSLWHGFLPLGWVCRECSSQKWDNPSGAHLTTKTCTQNYVTKIRAGHATFFNFRDNDNAIELQWQAKMQKSFIDIMK